MTLELRQSFFDNLVEYDQLNNIEFVEKLKMEQL